MSGRARAATGARAFREALRSSAYVVAQTWKREPAWLAQLVLANLVLAFTPAAQVLAVSWLVRSSSGSAGGIVVPLVVLIALVGVGQLIGSHSNMTRQRVRLRMRRRFQDEMMHAVASLPPKQLAMPETTALIQGSCCGTPVAIIDGGQPWDLTRLRDPTRAGGPAG